jgi:hypothetical protein
MNAAGQWLCDGLVGLARADVDLLAAAHFAHVERASGM